MSALENPPDCGRLLWTSSNFSLILLIFLAKLVYMKIETAKLVAFDRVTRKTFKEVVKKISNVPYILEN